MAVIVSKTQAELGGGSPTSLATASGFWRAEAYNVGPMGWGQPSNLTSTPVTLGVTFANSGNCQGVILGIVGNETASYSTHGSVTVVLQEYVTGVWTDRRTVTLTAAQIIGYSTVDSSGVFIVPFEFTGYAVTTAASTWRFSITGAAATNSWKLLTSDGSNYFYVTWCNTAVTFADNDCVIARAPTVIDKTATIKGVLGTGDSTFGIAALVCRASDPTAANVAYLQWASSPGASYTLTVDGVIAISSNGGFRAGTSSSRISTANKGIINFATRTVGSKSGFYDVGGDRRIGKTSLFIYGEIPSTTYTHFASSALANQASLTTNTTTGWSSGDTIAIGGESNPGARYGNGAQGIKTISSISGTSITCTGNIGLDVNFVAGGLIFRTNGYGFKVIGPTALADLNLNAPNNFVISGCELVDMQRADVVWYYNYTSQALRSTVLFEYSSIRITNGGSFYGTSMITLDGLTFDHCCFHNVTVLIYPAGSISSLGRNGDITFSNNKFVAASIGIRGDSGVLSCRMVVSNNEVWNGGYSTLCGSTSTLSGNNFYYCTYAGYSGWGVVTFANSINCQLSNNTYDGCDYVYGVGSAPGISCVDTTSSYGSTYANTNLLDVFSGGFFQIQLATPTGTPTVTTSNVQAGSSGSVLEFKNYNNTAGDYRSYTPYGYNYSTSSKLAMQATQSSYQHYLDFLLTTQAVSGAKLYYAVNCQIQNAAYYAGTYTAPSATLSYDNGSSTTAVASASTSSQTLSSVVTFATDSNPATLRLAIKSDATQANTEVRFDTAVFNLRKYGKTFLGSTLTLERYRSDTFQNLPTLSTDPYITQTTAATVAAYTGISVNHATQTCTITSNHSIQELYDYVHYDLTQTSNMGYAEWFTTIDGVTFSSTYNITINGCTLSGTGTKLSLPTKTFSLVSGGAYGGIATDSSGTVVPVTVSNLVTGSRVRIAKHSDNTEIVNAAESGGSVTASYTLIGASLDVDVTVRKAGYQQWTTQATITTSGLLVTAGQASDGTY